MDRELFKQTCAQHPDWLAEEIANAGPSANVPATFEQLREAFPQASSDFIVGQLSAKASIDAARNAESVTLRAEVGTLKKQLESANRQLAELDPGAAGLSAPLNTTAPRGSSTEQPGSLSSILQNTGHIPPTNRR